MSGKKDWLFRVQDMIDSIEGLSSHLANISESAFFADDFIQKATERYFEIIGEAARFIPKEIQEQYIKIPWGDIIGMRHKISHDYLEIDAGILWSSYKNDFPALKSHLEDLLEKEDKP
ncbi:MAG: hypothetical protein CO093_02875 [Alphaproteobacteria bacterium CG_4_9_14_3_um_filter_47_13]|nr:MAG: hypothetical protein CO093_02875 [Alphaproteobacteria bacterium CG_4_9_14_3_um_filter_47_13]